MSGEHFDTELEADLRMVFAERGGWHCPRCEKDLVVAFHTTTPCPYEIADLTAILEEDKT